MSRTQARLAALINLAATDSLQLERAVRAWADNNPKVQQAIQEVDAQRLSYLEGVFGEMGLSPEIAFARARVVYYAFLGQMVVGEIISAEKRTTMLRTRLFLDPFGSSTTAPAQPTIVR